MLFNYFNNLPSAERDEKFLKTRYEGVVELLEAQVFFKNEFNRILTSNMSHLKERIAKDCLN